MTFFDRKSRMVTKEIANVLRMELVAVVLAVKLKRHVVNGNHVLGEQCSYNDRIIDCLYHSKNTF